MRASVFVVVLVLAAATTAAQSPRKKACELLSAADVEAVLGIAPLRAFDPLNKGEYCRFEKAPGQAAFSVQAQYTDVPDADAVLKWLKAVETKTYEKARPAAGIGDAAYYTELFGNPATPKTLTPQGYEAQFATNHLGHFLLAELLTANLTAEGARVVALSSTGHLRSPVVFDDIHFERRDYDPWLAYGQSKTADALFAVELTRRLADKGVTANAVHPGGIMTGLQKHMDPADIKARGWVDEAGKVNPAFKTTEQGAATSVWAATAPELEGVGGRYLEDCQEAEPWRAELPYAGYAPYALDPEAAARLWTVSRAMVGLG